MASVTVDSGGFKSSKGVVGGALDKVIGEWQKIARSQFQDSAELLLPIIAEIDETRLWETYWDGMFKTREEFLAKKVLIDFDFVETALPEILDRLKRGETVKLSRKDEIEFVKNNLDKTNAELAKVIGKSERTVRNRKAAKDVIITENLPPIKPKLPRYQITGYTQPSVAAEKIRAKFGDEFALALKQAL